MAVKGLKGSYPTKKKDLPKSEVEEVPTVEEARPTPLPAEDEDQKPAPPPFFTFIATKPMTCQTPWGSIAVPVGAVVIDFGKRQYPMLLKHAELLGIGPS